MKSRFFVNTSVGLFALSAAFLLSGSQHNAIAQEDATPTASATVSASLSGYSTLLDSDIRGIDQKTIDAYRKGEGAGLALPAELNSYPGPRHVLDLSDKLHLTADQRVKIQVLYDVMKLQAIPLGYSLLEGEAKLEKGFRDKTLDATALQSQLTELGNLQAQLRFVHLNAHLTTVAILTPGQVAIYNSLRGYSSDMSGMPGMSSH